VSGQHFRADFLTLSDSLSLNLGPLELDLARIGAAAYVADRITRRAAIPIAPARTEAWRERS
jgi:hypothetical protein